MKTQPFTELEIAAFRAETPGTQSLLHFNNAGASLPTNAVIKAVTDYLQEEALTGGYEIEAKYSAELENVYKLIGQLINADASEIALVENASAGWCIAFHGIDFRPGDEVIVSELEYVTNVIGVLNAKRLYGVEIKVVPNGDDGNFSLERLEQAITPRTKLIAVTQIASATGVVLPVAEIGQVARKRSILYLVDACQSAGQLPVDVEVIGCDFLSVTGRKYLRAPRGTGFLYVRKAVQDQLKALFIDGHAIKSINQEGFQLRDDAKRFEFYEKNRAITLGLGKAVAYALNIGLEKIWQRIDYLADQLRTALRKIEGITVHDEGQQLCGIVTFSLAGADSKDVKQQLQQRGINTTVGMAQSTPYFMNRQGLQSVVRASLHYYNTETEITTFCEALKAIKA